jgi:DNA-binding NarL/FixJ family response regulator
MEIRHVARRVHLGSLAEAQARRLHFGLRMDGGEEWRSEAEPCGVIRARIDADGRVEPDELASVPSRASLWSSVVAGRLGLVERGSATSRRFFLVENTSSSPELRALSAAEVDVVVLCARGETTKSIAYALGIAPSLASKRLSTAAAKIGGSSRTALVRLAAILLFDETSPRPAEEALTGAERAVLELLRHGLSNEEIAERRKRSVRTIANQVAALLRKTKSPSRRSFVVRPRG